MGQEAPGRLGGGEDYHGAPIKQASVLGRTQHTHAHQFQAPDDP